MKKNLKRNIVMCAVLLFVCASVYLNWSYNNRWGKANEAMVEAEDEAMEEANALYEQLVAAWREQGIHVETGVFGADMQVESINDGPVTLILDTDQLMEQPRR